MWTLWGRENYLVSSRLSNPATRLWKQQWEHEEAFLIGGACWVYTYVLINTQIAIVNSAEKDGVEGPLSPRQFVRESEL
jgi:hypothetical protein